jgi:hypothetical protein
MALWLMAVATAVPFIRQPGWRTATWHALACALAIDVRIMGVLLPTASLAFIGIKALRRDYRLQPTLVAVGLFTSLLVVLTVAMWPYLWQAPLANFTVAFHNMSHFRLLVPVLYQGQLFITNRLPWHYTLVWIGITTPLLYVLLIGIGLILILANILTRHIRLFKYTSEWQDLLFLSLGLGPLAAVIGLHSVLYSGWRQLYFIYPMLLLVGLRGLVAVWHWQPLGLASQPALLAASCECNSGSIAGEHFRTHGKPASFRAHVFQRLGTHPGCALLRRRLLGPKLPPWSRVASAA